MIASRHCCETKHRLDFTSIAKSQKYIIFIELDWSSIKLSENNNHSQAVLRENCESGCGSNKHHIYIQYITVHVKHRFSSRK